MLELTLEKAKDLNEIVAKSLEKNQLHSEGFDLSWYQSKVRPDFSKAYYYHLYSLIKFYNEKYKRNWITTGVNATVSSNPNTAYFFQEGGFIKILELETRDLKIKELTEKQLQKNIFQLKYWWWILILGGVISTLISLIIKWLSE